MLDLRAGLRALAFAALAPAAAGAADLTPAAAGTEDDVAPAAAPAEERSWRLPAIPGEWTIMLGVEGKMLPAFAGASGSLLSAYPVISVRPTGFSARSGQAARFRSPRDSAGISLINADGFYFGPVGKFRSARKEGDHEQLQGLGDVDWAIEVGAFAEYWPSSWLRTRVELRRGFNGHQGYIADLSTDVVATMMEGWTLSGGPRLTLADSNAMAPYFGIDAAQSLASGLATFDAKGGLYSAGAGIQSRYQWNAQWASRVFVEYERLLGDAAASPLVSQRGSPNQVTLGAGTTYSFNKKLW